MGSAPIQGRRCTLDTPRRSFGATLDEQSCFGTDFFRARLDTNAAPWRLVLSKVQGAEYVSPFLVFLLRYWRCWKFNNSRCWSCAHSGWAYVPSERRLGLWQVWNGVLRVQSNLFSL